MPTFNVPVQTLITELIDKLEITPDEFRRGLRRHGLGQSTVDRLFAEPDDKPLRPQAVNNLVATLRNEWRLSVLPQWFFAPNAEDFRRKIDLGNTQFTLPWEEENLLKDGVYCSFRITFSDSKKISVEHTVVKGSSATTYYLRESDLSIGMCVGNVMSSDSGIVIMSTNAIAHDNEKNRPRMMCLHSKQFRSRYFGYLMSSSPIHFHPCVAPVVMEKREDGATESAWRALTKILTIDELSTAYGDRAASILYVLDIQNSSIDKTAAITAEKFHGMF